MTPTLIVTLTLTLTLTCNCTIPTPPPPPPLPLSLGLDYGSPEAVPCPWHTCALGRSLQQAGGPLILTLPPALVVIKTYSSRTELSLLCCSFYPVRMPSARCTRCGDRDPPACCIMWEILKKEGVSVVHGAGGARGAVRGARRRSLWLLWLLWF